MVRQALAGAGLASLYASLLIAANLYHLITPLTAMLGMAGGLGGILAACSPAAPPARSDEPGTVHVFSLYIRAKSSAAAVSPSWSTSCGRKS